MMTKALKGTLAAAAGIALSLTGVAAAQAQDAEPTPASGEVDMENGIRLHGQAPKIDGEGKPVVDENGEPVLIDKAPEATMLGLDLGGDDVRTVYCIQLNVGLVDNTHVERPWEDVPVADLPKVLGVLVNGYNGSNAGELLEDAGLASDDYGDWTPDQLAYAATQSAVWSLTDGWVIDADDPTEGDDTTDMIVTDLQDYLIANSEPIDEPDFTPEFDVDASEATTEGTTFGPLTAMTNIDSIEFAQPEGASIVDESGEEITTLVDGQEFFVKFDEAATTTVTLVTETVTWTTPAGRTFVPVDDAGAVVTGQRLILAEEHPQEITFNLPFELVVEEVPSESPKPQLPVTGASLTTVASVGGAVLLAGVVAMVLMRRRAARANWGSDA